MQCAQCQQPVESGQRFCGTCGAPVIRKRQIPWRGVIISSVILLLLGGAGFLYFLQATHEVVLWVEKMKEDEVHAVAVANQFLAHVNARDFESACKMNENSWEYCTEHEIPRYERLTEGGAALQAIYARRYTDVRGYMMYKVVVKQTKNDVDTAFWLQIAPDSPEPPVITGPLHGTPWDKQIMKRLSK